MTKLKCQRCEKQWEYKGKSKWYTSCPNCRTSVKVNIKGEKHGSTTT